MWHGVTWSKKRIHELALGAKHCLSQAQSSWKSSLQQIHGENRIPQQGSGRREWGGQAGCFKVWEQRWGKCQDYCLGLPQEPGYKAKSCRPIANCRAFWGWLGPACHVFKQWCSEFQPHCLLFLCQSKEQTRVGCDENKGKLWTKPDQGDESTEVWATLTFS